MTIWLLIYSVAGGQALLLAIALWQRPFDRHANRFLAAWMLLVCIDLGVRAWAQIDQSGLSYRPMRMVTLFPYLHASAFYLYVRTLISGKPLSNRDGVHAAGFVTALALSLDVLLASSAQIDMAIKNGVRLGFWRQGHWSNLMLFSYSVAYIGAALRAVGRQRQLLLETRSDVDPNGLRWLVVVAASQCVIWLVAILDSVVPFAPAGNELIYTTVAAWVLLAGYWSLVQPPTVQSASANFPVAGEQEAGIEVASVTRQSQDDAAPDPRFDLVAARLTELMEAGQIYRETALSIAQVARRSGYPEYLVSAVINRRFGCPFWDYVNRYRVTAARDCLSDPLDSRTALEIAYDCGFSSKSTFNAAFKRFLGETPSECRRRVEQIAPSSG